MSRAKSNLIGGIGWQAQAMNVLRPSVEAVLLAGVALGCAQLGWQAVAPQVADASGSESATMDLTPLVGETRSPFAPLADASPDAHQTAAAVAGLKLAGVRMARDPALSGAVLTLEGGDQRAFLVGQEVAAGVRLAAVNANFVLLSFAGGETQLELASQAATGSYAMALMGKAPSPSAALSQVRPSEPAATISIASSPTPTVSPTSATASPLAASSAPFSTAVASADERRAPVADNQAQLVALDQGAGGDMGAAWIAATLAQPQADGGWRVASPLPDAVRAVGIREGDVVVGVNGAAPRDPAQVLSAAKEGPVVIDVERASGERVTVTVGTQAPS